MGDEVGGAGEGIGRGEAAGERRVGRSRSADYRLARIFVAITLGLVIAVLSIGDLLMPGDQVSPSTLVILGIMVLTLLGLEARDLMRGGQP